MDLKIDKEDVVRHASRTSARSSGPSFQARYSRFVALMKVLLPAFAAALLGIVFAWPKVAGRDSAVHLAFGDFNLKAVDTLSMQNPHYYGTDNKNLPFTITASVATQVDPSNMVVSLEKPVADLTRKNNVSVIINSDLGFYRQKDDILDLMGHVDLYEDNGYEVHTESARVGVKEGDAFGDEPTKGQGPTGTIEGEGFRLLERGRTIMFTGKSKAVLYMAKPKARS